MQRAKPMRFVSGGAHSPSPSSAVGAVVGVDVGEYSPKQSECARISRMASSGRPFAQYSCSESNA